MSFFAWFCGVLVLLPSLYVGLPTVWLRTLRRRLDVECRANGTIQLEFDDGPGEVMMPLLLELLQHGSTPTHFFPVGRQAERSAGLLIEAARRGHEVGFHGYDHVHHWKAWPWATVRDVRRGLATVQTILGTRDVLPFRPPYGKLNLISLLYLWWHRIPIRTWTVDGGDTRGWAYRAPETGAILVGRRGGGVVLLHDHDRVDPEAMVWVLRATAGVLAATRDPTVPAAERARAVDEALARLVARLRDAKQPVAAPVSV